MDKGTFTNSLKIYYKNKIFNRYDLQVVVFGIRTHKQYFDLQNRLIKTHINISFRMTFYT